MAIIDAVVFAGHEADVEELELLQVRRQEQALDEQELFDLRESKEQGNEVDDDLLYELDLLYRKRHGKKLSDDELYEFEMFERRRSGEDLTEDELNELDLLKEKRVEIAQDEAALIELRERRANGKRFDEDLLYELELFSRHRDGAELNDDELFELDLFERRRNGELLPLDELKELDVLKQKRAKTQTAHPKKKKMRRKKKKPDDAPMDESGVATKLVSHVPSTPVDDASETAAVPESSQPAPQVDEPQRKGFFGGLFRGGAAGGDKPRNKSRKSMLLDSERQKQEELIKQQLKELEMENELNQFKEMQDKFVEETKKRIEDMSKRSDESSSSWETDPEWDGSSDEESGNEGSESKFPASSRIAAVEHDATSKSQTQRRLSSRRTALSTTGASTQSNISARRRGALSKTGRENRGGRGDVKNKTKSDHDEDDGEASVTSSGPEEPKALAEKIRSGAQTPRKSKKSLLSAHLKAQKEERAGRKKGRHGDDISLGTLELEKSKRQKSKKKKEDSPSRVGGAIFDSPVLTRAKIQRPWQASDLLKVPHLGVSKAIKEEDPGKQSGDDKDDHFFENNVLEQSIFNFSHSFEDDVSDGEKSNSEAEAESVAAPEASNEETDPFSPAVNNLQMVGIAARFVRKLRTSIKDKIVDFDDAWENMEMDKNVAAQISQKREQRQRDRANGKVTKGGDGLEEVPRLFLFEGEKKTKKKKKRKKKRNRKLDNKLSREFRRAMREVFSDEIEEAYDKTFGEGKSEKQRRDSQDSQFFDEDESVGHSSRSGGESDASEGFGDDYLKRLREKSMQQEVKELLNDDKSQKSSRSRRSLASDARSRGSRGSRRRGMSKNKGSTASFDTNSVSLSVRGGRRRKRWDAIDPAEIYAQELKKQKEKKLFSVADLKKEMEDMRKSTSFGNFDAAPSAPSAKEVKSFKTPKSSRPSVSAANGLTGPMSSVQQLDGPAGLESLQKMTPQNQRPALDRKISHFSMASNRGLLSGARLGFDMGTKKSFDMGVTSTIDEESTTGFLKDGKPPSFGAGGGGFGGLAGQNGSSGPSTMPQLGASSQNFASPFNASGAIGGPGGIHQEPLPLPEPTDDDMGRSAKRWKFKTGAKKIFKSFKLPSNKKQVELGGGLNDMDDNSEGELGLLG